MPLPRLIERGAFGVPLRLQIEGVGEPWVSFKDVFDPDDPVLRSIVLVHVSAEEAPVAVWTGDQEHWSVAREDVNAHVCLLMGGDVGNHVHSRSGPSHSSGVLVPFERLHVRHETLMLSPLEFPPRLHGVT
jgi:hypothetical protein